VYHTDEIRLDGIVSFLDRELRIADFDDSSHNGRRVENPGRVTGVCRGVDASLEFFEEARRRGADMVVRQHEFVDPRIPF
jgi:putative NIF3 family GTP cyclohydrolase 1 type 2